MPIPATMANGLEAAATLHRQGDLSDADYQTTVDNMAVAHGYDPRTGNPSMSQQVRNVVEPPLDAATGAVRRGIKVATDFAGNIKPEQLTAAGAGMTGIANTGINAIKAASGAPGTPTPGALSPRPALAAAKPSLPPGSIMEADPVTGAPIGPLQSTDPQEDIARRALARAAAIKSAQVPQSMRIPGVRSHTAGLADIGGKIEEQRFMSDAAIRGAASERRTAAEGIGRAIDETAAAESEVYAKRSGLEQQRADQMRAQAKKYDELKTEWQGRVSDKRAKITEYEESAKYFNLSPEKVAENRAVLQDPSASDSDKVIAQQALAKGQEWDTMDTPQEVIAAIMMALGAGAGSFGSALTGASNDALKIVQSHYARKIQKQKDEIARRKGITKGAVNELDRLTVEMGDELLAERMMEQRELAITDQLIDNTVTRAKDARTAGNAAQLKAKLAERSAELNQDVEERIAAGAMQGLGAQAGIAGSVAGLEQQADVGRQRAAMAQSGAQAAGAAGSPYTIPGWGGAAVDRTAHGEARKFIGTKDKVAMLIDQIQDLREKPATFIPMTEERAQGDALVADLITTLKTLREMGASFTEFEQELVQGQSLGNIAEWGRVGARLDVTKANMEREADMYMTNRGFTAAPKIRTREHQQ